MTNSLDLLHKEISKITDKMIEVRTNVHKDGSGDLNPAYIEQMKTYNETLKLFIVAIIDIEKAKDDEIITTIALT